MPTRKCIPSTNGCESWGLSAALSTIPDLNRKVCCDLPLAQRSKTWGPKHCGEPVPLGLLVGPQFTDCVVAFLERPDRASNRQFNFCASNLLVPCHVDAWRDGSDAARRRFGSRRSHLPRLGNRPRRGDSQGCFRLARKVQRSMDRLDGCAVPSW